MSSTMNDTSLFDPLLLIPVENQVRELDPKLLLACVAAQRGFSSIVGSRREMEFNIDSFPSAIYLSKSMTIRSLAFFRVARRLGHKIVAWDEEALVHLPAKTYFSRRLNASAMKYVLALFAWGQDNVELWRQYPHIPQDVPIHAVGNPRSDMLRSEVRAYYAKDAQALRRDYGDFILVNTNFNHVNAFGPDINLFRPATTPGGRVRFGRAARGMSWEYASGLWRHKRAVFSCFQELIPALEQAFPGHTIVVRPHPTENPQVYQDIAASCRRVRVSNKGNVVPWLMAAAAMIHNGCTTAVEAYLMNVPAVSFLVPVNKAYDDDFYRLPNRLSHACFDFDELRQTLESILSGKTGVAETAESRELINRYIESQEGPMACERMIAILESMNGLYSRSRWTVAGSLQRWALSRGLSIARRLKSHLPGSHNRPEYQLHRYPELPLEEVVDRLGRLRALLGYGGEFRVESLSEVLFKIEPV